MPFLLSSAYYIRKHVFQDLQPYVCLFEDCPTGNQLFETYEEWLDHEKWNHNLQWHCEDPNHGGSFSSQEDFDNHLAVFHDPTDNPSLSQLCRSSRHPSPELWSICPICGFVPQLAQSSPLATNEESTLLRGRLEKHIALHLRYFATLALPWREDVTEVDDIHSSRSRSRTMLTSLSLARLEFSGESVPDPESEVNDENIQDIAEYQKGLAAILDAMDQDWASLPAQPLSSIEDSILAHFSDFQLQRKIEEFQ
jgi:hypothetical protein